jgi:hypothetical protein
MSGWPKCRLAEVAPQRISPPAMIAFLNIRRFTLNFVMMNAAWEILRDARRADPVFRPPTPGAPSMAMTCTS